MKTGPRSMIPWVRATALPTPQSRTPGQPTDVRRVFALLIPMLLSGCAGVPAQSTHLDRLADFEPAQEFHWRNLRISEAPSTRTGTASPDQSGPVTLDEQRTQALLARLPALPKPDALPAIAQRTAEYAARSYEVERRRLLPAGTGAPTPSAPAASTRALRIVQVELPESAAPGQGIRLRFDRPMAPLGVQAVAPEIAARLRLEPELQGRWLWLGPQTLGFHAGPDPLPMATEVRVDVLAGLSAMDGSALEHTQTYVFSTPALRFLWAETDAMEQPDELARTLLLAFDQPVDAERLLPYLELLASQNTSPPPDLRPLAASEIVAEQVFEWNLRRTRLDHVLVLRTAVPLSPENSWTIRMLPGAPSAAGSQRTASVQEHRLMGFVKPFRLVTHKCPRYGDPCRIGDTVTFEFDRALDPEQAVAEWVHVNPPVDQLQMELVSNELRLRGLPRGRYTVRFAAGMRDKLDRSLGEEASIDVLIEPLAPVLLMPEQALVTLDPRGQARLAFHHINLAGLQLTVRRAHPSDWHTGSQGDWRLSEDVVFEGHWPLAHEPDQLMRSFLPVHEWLGDSQTGHLILQVHGVKHSPGEWSDAGRRPPELHYRSNMEIGGKRWLQVTRLSLDTVTVSEGRHWAWATGLPDGKALHDATIEVLPGGSTVQTDARGLAELPAGLGDNSILLLRKGDDTALLPWTLQGVWPRSTWVLSERASHRVDGQDPRPVSGRHRGRLWHVVDVPGVYRPGQTVHLKGWVRDDLPRKHETLDASPAGQPLRYRLLDSQRNRVAEGDTELSRLGGFGFSVELPSQLEPGAASLELELGPPTRHERTDFRHEIQIEAFRSSAFEIQPSLPHGPLKLGQDLDANVAVQYLTGEPAADVPIQWAVRLHEMDDYAPPERGDWHFGPPGSSSCMGASPTQWLSDVRTDASGRHAVRIDLSDVHATHALRLESDVRVQGWARRAEATLHPGELYVGLRTPRRMDSGVLAVDFIVVDVHGTGQARKQVRVDLAEKLVSPAYGPAPEPAPRSHCLARTNQHGLGQCRFKVHHAAMQSITATVIDAQGRHQVSQLDWIDPNEQGEPRLQLRLDRERYRPGDIARLHIQAPFDVGEAWLLLARQGVFEQRQFRIRRGSAELEFRVSTDWIPGIEMLALAVAAPSEARDAAFPSIQASGQHTLRVSDDEQRLKVLIRPQPSRLAPGDRAGVDVTVLQPSGRAAADAELSLMVVDESALERAGFVFADPMDSFHPAAPRALLLRRLRDGSQLLAQRPEQHARRRPGMDIGYPRNSSQALERITVCGSSVDDAGAASHLASPHVRSDFDPVAAFLPGLRTDSNGQVRAEFTLPDSLTRYRILVLAAADGQRFGSAQSSLQTRQPLMIRAEPPRFLHQNDRFELPVTLHNPGDRRIEVELALHADGLEPLGPTAWRVPIEAETLARVQIPLRAARLGESRYQLIALSAESSDALHGSIPVYAAFVPQVQAMAGILDSAATSVWSVQIPGLHASDHGRLTITSAATLWPAAPARVATGSPQSRQSDLIASEFLALAVLNDPRTRWPLADPTERDKWIRLYRHYLTELSHRRFPAASREHHAPEAVEEDLRFLHGLLIGHQTGQAMDPGLVQRGKDYLQDPSLESRIAALAPPQRLRLLSYTLYLRALYQTPDSASAARLLAEVEDVGRLDPATAGWLLMVLARSPETGTQAEALRRSLDARIEQTATHAQFRIPLADRPFAATGYEVLLEALVATEPGPELPARLITRWLAGRYQPIRFNAPTDAFLLLVLSRYWQRFEPVPDQVPLQIWLDDQLIDDQLFPVERARVKRLEIPVAPASERGNVSTLTLVSQGAAPVYHRAELDYVQRDPAEGRWSPGTTPDASGAPPLQQGFALRRRYRAIDAPGDVQRMADRSWQIRAGARVEVGLLVISPERRFQVDLIDRFPAGFQALEFDADVDAWTHPSRSGESAMDPTIDLDDLGIELASWESRDDISECPGSPEPAHDDRIELHAHELHGGWCRYRYHVRASLRGRFVVPPAVVEERHTRELRANTAYDRIEIQ